MDEHNVLVISYYFPPMGLSGVQRTLKFVKYLPEFGWNPIILTTQPSSYYAFDDELEQEVQSLGLKIYRTSTARSIRKKIKKFPSSYLFQNFGRLILNFFLQPDTKIAWRKRALDLGEQIMKTHSIDVIYATAPPFTDFLVARELSRKFDKPFVIDYRDVWVDNPFQLYPTFFHRSFSRKLEESILKEAEKIIVTYRGIKDTLLTKYRFLRSQDVVIIPHGYDSEDFKFVDDVVPAPNRFVVTHSGLFQDNRNPKYFLKAFSRFLSSRNDGILKEAWFVGIMRKSHIRYIRSYDLEGNVKLFGYRPHKDVVRILKQSNLLWLMFEDTVRSPGKLYEYFGARKPVLICAPDGYMKRLALESHSAIGVEPRDVEGIYQALNTFYDMWLHSALPSPSQDFIQQFDRKKLTQELAKQLSLSSDL